MTQACPVESSSVSWPVVCWVVVLGWSPGVASTIAFCLTVLSSGFALPPPALHSQTYSYSEYDMVPPLFCEYRTPELYCSCVVLLVQRVRERSLTRLVASTHLLTAAIVCIALSTLMTSGPRHESAQTNTILHRSRCYGGTVGTSHIDDVLYTETVPCAARSVSV